MKTINIKVKTPYTGNKKVNVLTIELNKVIEYGGTSIKFKVSYNTELLLSIGYDKSRIPNVSEDTFHRESIVDVVMVILNLLKDDCIKIHKDEYLYFNLEKAIIKTFLNEIIEDEMNNVSSKNVFFVENGRKRCGIMLNDNWGSLPIYEVRLTSLACTDINGNKPITGVVQTIHGRCEVTYYKEDELCNIHEAGNLPIAGGDALHRINTTNIYRPLRNINYNNKLKNFNRYGIIANEFNDFYYLPDAITIQDLLKRVLAKKGSVTINTFLSTDGNPNKK